MLLPWGICTPEFGGIFYFYLFTIAGECEYKPDTVCLGLRVWDVTGMLQGGETTA